MKIRNGFVSNSSSSSFVIMGFTVPRKKFSMQYFLQNLYDVDHWDSVDDVEDKYWDLTLNHKFTVRDHEENGAPKDKTIVGIVVAQHGSHEDFDAGSFDLTQLLAEAAEAREKLKLSPDTAPIKLYVGSQM